MVRSPFNRLIEAGYEVRMGRFDNGIYWVEAGNYMSRNAVLAIAVRDLVADIFGKKGCKCASA